MKCSLYEIEGVVSVIWFANEQVANLANNMRGRNHLRDFWEISSHFYAQIMPFLSWVLLHGDVIHGNVVQSSCLRGGGRFNLPQLKTSKT